MTQSTAFDFKNASKEELDLEYKRIAKEVGDDRFFTKKELRYLPEILMEREQIVAFSSGIMDGKTWLITLTDKRVVFLDKGMLYGLKQTSIPISKISSVSGETGMMFGKITISTGSDEKCISKVWKKTVRPFTNRLNEIIEAGYA